MRDRRLAVVGAVLVCIVVASAVGFVMASRGAIGICGPATFCQHGTFCMCPEYYAPVYGFPHFKVYSNDCFACIDGAWLWIRI